MENLKPDLSNINKVSVKNIRKSVGFCKHYSLMNFSTNHVRFEPEFELSHARQTELLYTNPERDMRTEPASIHSRQPHSCLFLFAVKWTHVEACTPISHASHTIFISISPQPRVMHLYCIIQHWRQICTG